MINPSFTAEGQESRHPINRNPTNLMHGRHTPASGRFCWNLKIPCSINAEPLL